MQWSLILSGFADAARNMAVDEAIFTVAQQTHDGPLLRLYGWDPPALSIGYFQSAGQALSVCKSTGAALVRRPTGGSGILHADDLTYSVCIDCRNLARTHATKWVYNAVHAALLRGLNALGASAQMRGETPRAPRAWAPQSGFCFDRPSEFDIMVGHRKLVGSAQRRRGHIILQHGSIPLRQARHPRQVIALDAIIGREVTFDEAAEHVRRGFEDEFDAEFVARDLAADEQRLADELARSKYSTDAWNFRRP